MLVINLAAVFERYYPLDQTLSLGVNWSTNIPLYTKFFNFLRFKSKNHKNPPVIELLEKKIKFKLRNFIFLRL